MHDLSHLLTAHPFPAALARVRGAFARQADRQTCGAAAIRHGLLLGGLTLPAAALEAVLGIRDHEGTPPAALRACLRRLGLAARAVRKPARQTTAAFFEGLRGEFERGAFLIPCVHGGEHWVCLGGWRAGRVGLVDSFFDRWRPARRRPEPGLGFFSLRPEELDALDWRHHVTLVRPGAWRAQFEAWLPARPALLRMPACGSRPPSVAQALGQAAHQYLNDADYSYGEMALCLAGGVRLRLRADDPGQDAVGVEALGRPGAETIVVRRLGGALAAPAPPEWVVRGPAVRLGSLAG
jgi:hypothetical protein